MRSRFVLSPGHDSVSVGGRVVSRIAGAIVFCFVGAVAASQLYPQMFAERRDYVLAPESGRAAAPPTTDATSGRTGRVTSFVAGDGGAYTGGPIPQLFPAPSASASAAPQSEPAAADAAAAAPDEARVASTAEPEKQRRTKNKSARYSGGSSSSSSKYSSNYSTSHHSYRREKERPYRQPPSTWVAGNGWNNWGGFQGGIDYGQRQSRGVQFARQFDPWR
jgi:hypothetical protein